MNESEIKTAILAAPKGANIMVVWERQVKLRAAYKTMPLTKHTSMLCRLGVEYDNKAATIEGRADGSLPAANAGLKGFEWEQYPTILRAIKSQKLYLRLEAGTFKNVKPVVEFRLDGQVVEKADYAHAMLSSETQPSKSLGTFNVGVDSIISVQPKKKPAAVETETCETCGQEVAETETA